MKKRFIFKSIWLGDKPPTMPDGEVGEVLYGHPVRLYDNGVGIGDYYRNIKTGECNVMFFMMGVLNRSVMLGAINRDKARAMLLQYATTGKVPYPEEFVNLIQAEQGLRPSYGTPPPGGFPFSGILGVDIDEPPSQDE